MPGSTRDGVRCADWSRTQELDPIGTAGIYAGYLLVEWPLPWPRDVGEIPELEGVRSVVAGLGLRLQLLVPRGDRGPRAAIYGKPEGPFKAFAGRELYVSVPDEAPERNVAPLNRLGDALGRAVERLVSGEGQPVSGHEVLVCTHGSRDRCCGSRGTGLWVDLDAAPPLGDANLRRTSHTGGHRFAATAVVLPEGTMWGFLDVESLGRIVARAGPLDDLLPRYRGCSGLDTPSAQALERAVLAELGWALFDRSRETVDLGDGRLRLTVATTTETAVWEARVVPGRTLPVPDCGQPVDVATKSETERCVVDLARVA